MTEGPNDRLTPTTEPSGPVTGRPRVPPGGSLASTIRRDANGQWYHDGAVVDHVGIQRSFDRWIERHENGRYVLKNDVNWAFVEIEGAPIFVRRVEVDAEGLRLALSDGREEWLQAESLRQDYEGRLYCQVRGGRLTAQFSRQATFDLEPVLGEAAGSVVIQVGERQVQPALTDTPIR